MTEADPIPKPLVGIYGRLVFVRKLDSVYALMAIHTERYGLAELTVRLQNLNAILCLRVPVGHPLLSGLEIERMMHT